MARGSRSYSALHARASAAWPMMEEWLRAPNPAARLRQAHECGDLALILPELSQVDGFDQRTPYHPEGDLLVHTLNVLDRLPRTEDTELAWVALFHDLGKPASCWCDADGVAHYYANPALGREAHEVISARIARTALARLGMPAARATRIEQLVAWHMLPRFSTPRGARRFVARVGAAAPDLLVFRQADGESGDAAGEVSRMRALLHAL